MSAERADVGLGLREDRLERLRAMADLEDRHADAGQRHEIALDLLEHRHRQHRGAGGEVEDAMNGHEPPSRKHCGDARYGLGRLLPNVLLARS